MGVHETSSCVFEEKGPFWYTKRPGFYDKLADALVHMNN